MRLSQGRIHRATPGPSIIPDKVLRAMNRAAPNIYDGEIIDITESILSDLADFAKASGPVIIYVANGHGAWEASISNLFKKDDLILVISTGEFGTGWANLAKKMGLSVKVLDFGYESTVDLDKLEEVLRKDKSHKIQAVLTVQTDTASSVLNDVKKIKETIEVANHTALLLVDSIACFGCDRFEMDKWGVDLMITASQKGLMTPPGLSYCFIGEKSLERSLKIDKKSPYWDWLPRLNPEIFYERFFGTVPTHHIFGQRAALDMLLREGRENVFKRHRVLAEAVWKAVDQWGQSGPLACNIAQKKYRSNAVTTITAPGWDLNALCEWLKLNTGLELGVSLGFKSSKYMNGKSVCRIAHMGHLNPFMILGIISTIETGLIACGIPHKAGGARSAAESIAKASN